MNIGIIGRSEILYDSCLKLHEQGHNIVFIITAKEAPEYRVSSDDFEKLASKIGADFIYAPKIKNVHNNLKEYKNLDIGVSYNYVDIINQDTIDLFKLGILNAHGGDLPRYRGNACQAWAILNKENKIGLCIHKMIGSELDSGDIVERDYLSINENTKITQIHEWMNLRVPELFIESLKKLKKDNHYVLEVQSKKNEDILRTFPRRPEDGKINWSQNSEEIIRLINATNKPYSGAFTFFEKKKVIIWDAEAVKDKENFLAIPGQITNILKNSIYVSSGNGKIKVNLLEIDGEELHPTEIIKSIRARFT